MRARVLTLRHCAVVAIAVLLGSASAQTGTYKDLFDFNQTSGYAPRSGAVLDSVGNMYVALQTQSPGYAGLIAKFAPNGVEKVLHNFNDTITYTNGSTGPDGSLVQGLALDASGNIFGVTANGGLYHSGIVFELTASGAYFDLHDFGGNVTNANGISGADGQTPFGNVVIDKYGNLFGVTENGGANESALESGIVWEITSAGVYRDLHDFGGTVTNANGSSGVDGGMPLSGPTLDASGNLYGVTSAGGTTGSQFSIGAGNVWEITTNGAYKDLHDFGKTVTLSNGSTGLDGYEPYCALAFDAAGNVYGTTSAGGAGSGGVLWKLTAGGVYKDLHDFGLQTVPYLGGSLGADGIAPESGVVVDAAGNLFGVTSRGGVNYAYEGGTMQQQGWVDYGGILYEFSASGSYQVLHAFGGTLTDSSGTYADGQLPVALTLDTAGNIYGSAATGGPTGNQQNTPPGEGMIFQLYYTALVGVSVSPASVVAGTTATGTVTLSAAAPAGGSLVTLWPSNSYASVPTTVVIPAGHTTATFPVSTYGVTNSTNVTITAGMVGVTCTASLTITPAQGLKLSLSPTSVAGGVSSTGTVTLTDPAGPNGLVVNLSSSSSTASVPTSISIPAGALTGWFTINTRQVSTLSAATITAGIGATTATAVLSVTPTAMTEVTISPSTVLEKTSATGTVTLSGPAPSGGSLVTLSSNSSCASVPASVSVPAGATTATFTITTSVVSYNTVATISATLNGTKTATVTVEPAVLSGITVGSNGQAFSPGSTTGVVILSGPTGPAGAIINLASDNSAVSVPSSVFVVAGQSSATFAITLSSNSQVQVANITAKEGSVSSSAQLQVLPAILSGLAVSPNSVLGGKSSVGTITLRTAASGNTYVTVASNNTSVTVPSKVTVPNGSSSVQFPITTIATAGSVAATITASQGSTQVSSSLTVVALSVSGLSLSPTSVAGGTNSTATVTLNAAAPSAGAVVALSSSSTSAIVPLSVSVSGGSTTATFTVSTKPVNNSTSTSISASFGGVTQTAVLSINPPKLVSVSVSPNKAVGGSAVTGTVTLSSPAPSSGELVYLYCYSSGVTVPSTVFVAAGGTSANFTVTTSSVSSNIAVTIYAVLGSVELTTTLTLTPAGLLSFQISPASVKGGKASIGTVTLTNAAGPYGAVVYLSSSNPSASVPAYAFIPSGSTSAKFTITTTAVGATTQSTISATLGSSTISDTLTLTH